MNKVSEPLIKAIAVAAALCIARMLGIMLPPTSHRAGRRGDRIGTFALRCIRPLLALLRHYEAIPSCTLRGVKRSRRKHRLRSEFDPIQTWAANLCCDAQHSPSCK